MTTEKQMPYPPQNRGVGDQQRAKRLRQVSEQSPRHKGLFERVFAGDSSPRQCIKAFCLECNGWETDAIAKCTAPACPLFNVRPFQKSKNN